MAVEQFAADNVPVAAEALTMLDLCSGIGGMSLGAALSGVRTVAFAEIEPFCCELLAYRFPDIPNLGDVYGITKDTVERLGRIDIVAGGIPCQPVSIAGKRRATADDRWLWPEMRRIVQLAQPTWVLIENVDHFVSLVLDLVSADLEADGYEVRAFVFPIASVGAPHERMRVFVVGHSREAVADTRRGRIQSQRGSRRVARQASHAEGETPQRQRDGDTAGCGRATRSSSGCIGVGQANADRDGQPQSSGVEREIGRWTFDHRQGMGDPIGERRGGKSDAATGDHRDGQTSRWTQGANRTEQSGEDADCRGEGLAFTTGRGFRRGQTSRAGGLAALSGESVEHTSGAGCEERRAPAEPGSAGYPAGRHHPLAADAGAELTRAWLAQRRLDRGFDGLPAWVDKHPWPAYQGQEQHPWEPSRVTPPKAERNRAARLKAIGNGLGPAQVAPVFAAIVETEQERAMHARGNAL